MIRQPTSGVVLEIRNLTEGSNHQTRRVTAKELELDWEGVSFGDGIDLELDIVRMGDNLQVDGHFACSIRATCDRCLQELDRELSGRFRVLGRRGDDQTHELADQDGIVFHEGSILEMSEEIREAVLLEVPMQLVCSEGCRGLCPACGADLNQGECGCDRGAIDPRWAALDQLRKPEQ
jgi:uncharacterized protein